MHRAVNMNPDHAEAEALRRPFNLTATREDRLKKSLESKTLFDSSFSILVVLALSIAVIGGAWSNLLHPSSKVGPRVLYAIATVLMVVKLLWNLVFRIVFENTAGAHKTAVFDEAAKHWTLQNWGRSYTFHPRDLWEPASVDELIKMVQSAGRKGRKVKPIGALHSWSSCAVTNDVAIRMHKLNKVLSYDHAALTVTAEAGIRLIDLYNQMTDLDLALPSVPNVDVITLGGAVVNATHGTNFQHGTLVSRVTALTIVSFRNQHGEPSNQSTAKAELITLKKSDASDRHWFEAAITSFGSLGIIYSLTLQCVEPYISSVFEVGISHDELKNNVLNLAQSYPCCQMTSLSNGALVVKVQVPISGRVISANTTNLYSDRDVLQSKVWFFAIQANPKTFIWLRKIIRACFSALINSSPLVQATLARKRTALMHWKDAEMQTRLSAAMSNTPWTNLEYALPAENSDAAYTALHDLFSDMGTMSLFTMRPVSADDCGYLSPANGRRTIYFDVPHNASLERTGIYQRVEQLLLSFGGRCSWSRLFKSKYSQVVKQYPNFPKFVQAKKEMDPFNIFSNSFSDGIIAASDEGQVVSYE